MIKLCNHPEPAHNHELSIEVQTFVAYTWYIVAQDVVPQNLKPHEG